MAVTGTRSSQPADRPPSAEHVLLDLSGRSARHGAGDLQPLRPELPGQACLFHVVLQLVRRRSFAVRDDDGAAALAEPLVRVGDDGHLADPVVLGQEILHLDDGNVLVAADDDVLAAADERCSSCSASP